MFFLIMDNYDPSLYLFLYLLPYFMPCKPTSLSLYGQIYVGYVEAEMTNSIQFSTKLFGS